MYIHGRTIKWECRSEGGKYLLVKIVNKSESTACFITPYRYLTTVGVMKRDVPNELPLSPAVPGVVGDDALVGPLVLLHDPQHHQALLYNLDR